MTEHLELDHLTSFAARYLLARSVRARPNTKKEKKVLEIIEAEANGLSAKPVPLQDNFKRFCQTIERQRADFGLDISDGLARSLTKLLQDLGKHSCDNCVRAPQDKRCEPDKQTNDIVHERGACIAPLKALFDDLCKWVAGLWHELPQSTGMPDRPVVFATSVRSFVRDRPILKEFKVSGYAQALLDRDGKYTEDRGHYTQVGLEIRDDYAFGWQQYSLLPYLLLHEILCHAFQSLDKPEVRRNAPASDAWSEGWMDALAFQLALEWLKDHDKTAFIDSDEYRDAECQIDELHKARYVEELSADGISHPGDGRKAFHDVLDSYPKWYARLPQTRHPVTQFSLRLNAMTLPLAQRVRDLVRLQYLAKNDRAALHRLIGDFNAEADDRAALKLLERASQ
jgi:hypothetical protein